MASLLAAGETTKYVVTIKNVATFSFYFAFLLSPDMARSYCFQDCPVAPTLDPIRERWTILILRDLFWQGPRRFQDFQVSLRGVAPNTLSARLKELERRGIIARKLYSQHPPRLEYRLTERGKTLGPVVRALRDWGKQYG